MSGHFEQGCVAGNRTSLPATARPKEGLAQFRVLHVAAVILIFPVVGATRLFPSHWREHRGESIFAETNRTVLTALGTAFML